MSDRPSQYRIDMQLAIIAKLRELDTTGEHRATCDRDELEWRRLAMEGYQPCPGGGIILPGYSQSAMELLRLDPQAYFETVALRRPRGRVPSAPEERERVWDEARVQAEKDLPTLMERWRRRRK